MRRLLVLTMLLLACAHPRSTATPRLRLSLDAEVARLTLPPGSETRAALARLDDARRGGELRAGWARLHYLIDLFDHARLARDAHSRALLLDTLAVKDGPGATDRALDALLGEVGALEPLDPRHADTRAARALLEDDRRPPRDLLARTRMLKSIARGGGDLAANATLRLAGFCRAALHDAARALPRDRPALVAQCLYPLYDADPARYFAEAPPPEPSPIELGAELARLERAAGGRLAPISAALASEDETYAAQHGLADRLEPLALHLPLVGAAAPYRQTPLVEDGLDALLARDGRRAAAVALAGEEPADELVAAAAAARKAGASIIELLVGYPEPLPAPMYDYWRERAPGRSIVRAGAIPIALDVARDDPTRTLGLHLVVSPDAWRLVAPDGAFPALATEGGGFESTRGLRATLEAVRRAYPEEEGLTLVLEGRPTVAALAWALEAAARSEDGQPLFTRIALGASAPAVSPKGDLVDRVKRRSAFDVALAPSVLAVNTIAVRHCVLDASERLPKLAGVLRLKLGGGGAEIVAGPEDPALRHCVLDRLGPAMARADVTEARVTIKAILGGR